MGKVPNVCPRFSIQCPNCPVYVVTLHALVRQANPTMYACLNIQLLTGGSMIRHEPRSRASVRGRTVVSMLRWAMRTV